MRKRKKIYLLFLLIVFVNNFIYADRTVVCSIFPLSALLKNLISSDIKVFTLVPPGASPHTYEISISKAKIIAKANIFFKIGAGLEIWADKIIKGINPHIKIVCLSKGIPLIKHQHQLEIDSNHTHIHGINPHIWLDPIIAMYIVIQMSDVLCEYFPDKSQLFIKNRNRYIIKLMQLDLYIRKEIEKFNTKYYVSLHPAWSYFARRYGLKCVGVIKSSHGSDIGPKQFNSLIEKVKKYKIKAIFVEPQLNDVIAHNLAKICKVKLCILDPLGGIEGRDSYIKLMKYNIKKMREVMGPEVNKKR